MSLLADLPMWCYRQSTMASRCCPPSTDYRQRPDCNVGALWIPAFVNCQRACQSRSSFASCHRFCSCPWRLWCFPVCPRSPFHFPLPPLNERDHHDQPLTSHLTRASNHRICTHLAGCSSDCPARSCMGNSRWRGRKNRVALRHSLHRHFRSCISAHAIVHAGKRPWSSP